MLFRRRRANYSELRKKAVSLTRHELSSRLLSRFEALVYHPGMSGNTDVHYQDREILGAVCCTPAEAMLMHHAARLCNPLHPIEIGSYIGWSSAHIASSWKAAGSVKRERYPLRVRMRGSWRTWRAPGWQRKSGWCAAGPLTCFRRYRADIAGTSSSWMVGTSRASPFVT
jgi:hypothetical protein